MVASGTRAWFQTGKNYPSTSYPRGQADSNNNWINVINFESYIRNGGSNIVGPYGCTYTYSVTNAEKGDILQTNASGSWGHTYEVEAVTGTLGSRTVSDIWVCSHTGNRNHNQLSTIFSNANQLRTVKILGYWTNP
jgi:hypothetical protein